MIILSYLGWVAAQITALGLVFSLLSDGAISMPLGMVIGTTVVLVYTLFGGMWSVALTDFVQMIVIGLGLIAIAWFAADLAGGAGKVIDYAAREGKFQFFPTGGAKEWIFFFAAAITMMLGSIPQQDVFQRVMSSNSAQTAVRGPVIGGTLYFLFALIPMFVVTAAVLVMGDEAQALLKDDPQKVLPTLVHGAHAGAAAGGVLRRAAVGHHVHRLGHAAGAQHHLRRKHPAQHAARHERQGHPEGHAPVGARRHGRRARLRHHACRARRSTNWCPAPTRCRWSGAFVPLVFGLYWKRATTQGALASVVLGLGTWLASWPRRPGRRPSRSNWPASSPRWREWWSVRCCRSGWRITRGTCTISRAASPPEPCRRRAAAPGGRPRSGARRGG